VTDKTPFLHRARPEWCKMYLSFDYRIVARRLGYEDVRMAPAADPTLAIEEVKALEESQP